MYILTGYNHFATNSWIHPSHPVAYLLQSIQKNCHLTKVFTTTHAPSEIIKAQLHGANHSLPTTRVRTGSLRPTDTQSEHRRASSRANNRGQITVTQSRLPRPGTNSNKSTRRDVRRIPKARSTKNGLDYYKICEDQVNKNLGECVPEVKLT